MELPELCSLLYFGVVTEHQVVHIVCEYDFSVCCFQDISKLHRRSLLVRVLLETSDRSGKKLRVEVLYASLLCNFHLESGEEFCVAGKLSFQLPLIDSFLQLCCPHPGLKVPMDSLVLNILHFFLLRNLLHRIDFDLTEG